MSSTKQGISVIICCYNSEKRIQQTLNYLFAQKVEKSIKWEIIVVDNASTDGTAKTVQEQFRNNEEANFTCKIVTEPTAGLSFARQKGVAVATYDYFIFCDDDNWLHDEYVGKAFELISKNPKIGAIGGKSYAISDTSFPDWFERYKSGYAVGEQGKKSGDITYRGYVWGAGLVSRKKLFLSAYDHRFPGLLTDRKKDHLTSGGDYEYCQRIILKNFLLYYSEELTFAHFIPENRLTIDYRDKLYRGFEEATNCHAKYSEAIELKRASYKKKIDLLISAQFDLIKSILKKRKLTEQSRKTFFYFLNIGYRNDYERQLIRKFYKSAK